MEYQKMPKIDRLKQVKEKTGHRATSTIYAHIQDGLFPKAVRISQRSVGWPSHEVEAVIHARIAGDSDAAIRRLVDRLHEQRKGLAQPTPEAKAPASPLSLAGV